MVYRVNTRFNVFIGVIPDNKCIIFVTNHFTMESAIISGDIIASTSLNEVDREKIGESFKTLSRELGDKFNVYSRTTEGDDSIVCYVPNIPDALRVMLAIKCFIKSVPISIKSSNQQEDIRQKFFKMHGIRLAMGIGELSRLDVEKGIFDGEAIYYSGRLLSENKTYNKGKIIIKSTLFLKSNDPAFDVEILPLLALLDVMLSKCTSKQSEVLYLKLIGNDEMVIAEMLNKSQSTINEHSTQAGWNAIEKAVTRFEEKVRIKQSVS